MTRAGAEFGTIAESLFSHRRPLVRAVQRLRGVSSHAVTVEVKAEERGFGDPPSGRVTVAARRRRNGPFKLSVIPEGAENELMGASGGSAIGATRILLYQKPGLTSALRALAAKRI